jgi:hypothetical protein
MRYYHSRYFGCSEYSKIVPRSMCRSHQIHHSIAFLEECLETPRRLRNFTHTTLDGCLLPMFSQMMQPVCLGPFELESSISPEK